MPYTEIQHHTYFFDHRTLISIVQNSVCINNILITVYSIATTKPLLSMLNAEFHSYIVVAAEPLLPSPSTELHRRTHLRYRTYNLRYISTILSTINGILTTIHTIVTAELLLLPLNAEFHGRAYLFDCRIPAYYVQRSQYYIWRLNYHLCRSS